MVVPAIVIRRATNQTRIETKVLPNFEPKHYIYRRLGFDPETMSFVYKVRGRPVKEGHPKFGNITDFARHILSKKHRPKKDDAEKKPLDVTVREDSYLIFELPQGWTFSPLKLPAGHSAVTLGAKPEKEPDTGRYANLRYVTATEDSEEPLANCRLVYFSAKKNDGTATTPYEQPINFNIVMPDGVVVIIDPDVRFPGIGGEQTDPPG